MASALPHDGNYLDDQSSYLLETIWSLTAVSCLLIGVRMYTQIAVVGHVNMSDYLMLLALVGAPFSSGRRASDTYRRLHSPTQASSPLAPPGVSDATIGRSTLYTKQWR